MMNGHEEHELLGTIETAITGCSHYRARLERGDGLALEREPGNPHDRNAVRVLNGSGEQAGYLPRRVVSWLAPLLDTRTVDITGRLASRRSSRPDIRPVDLHVYTSAHGHDLLLTDVRPASLRDALHNVIAQAHAEARSWDNPALVRALGRRLWQLDQHDLSPQSRLVLSLFPGLAREKEARQYEDAVERARETLLSLAIGPAVGYDNLQVFPFIGRNGRTRDYALLSEAIARGDVEVTEVSEAGSVPELAVANRGGQPVIIPEGEILTGAKQNRVVNITVLVAARSKVILPVSCVERGRWAKVSPGFHATHFAPPRARGRKTASVNRQRTVSGDRYSDQGGVWDHVSEYMDRAGVHSRTESLTDTYEQTRDRLRLYREHVRPPADASGIVLAVSGWVIGLELFDAPETLAGLWDRLSEAYFFEAATNSRPCAGQVPDADVRRFLETVGAALSPVNDPVGAGTELEVNAEGYAGSALWHNGRLLHAAAFDAST